MSAEIEQPQQGALAEAKVPVTKVISWALWDWGTQPFATVVTTFVFAVYLTSPAFGNKDVLTQQLGWATAASGLFIAALAPVLGQGSDRTGKRMFHLRWQTWLLAAICAGMFFVYPEPQYFWLGAALLAVGNLIAEIANVNYYASIDQVSTPSNVGRISGLGWGLGYLGGITILLVILAVLGNKFTPSDVRVSMVICAVWTVVFTLPIFISLKDRVPEHPAPQRSIKSSYLDLFDSIRRVYRTSPNTLTFLAASALFRDGLAGVFAFGGVLAAGTFGFKFPEVVLFGVAANVVAGIATMLFGLLDDKVGPKRVILVSLASLVALGVGVFVFHDGGKIVFWVLGLLLCVFVGPAQSASRSFLARLIPEGQSGEFFGLYATTGRVASFISPMMFSTAIWIGMKVTSGSEQSAQYWGILGVVLVLAAGFVVALFVRDPESTQA